MIQFKSVSNLQLERHENFYIDKWTDGENKQKGRINRKDNEQVRQIKSWDSLTFLIWVGQINNIKNDREKNLYNPFYEILKLFEAKLAFQYYSIQK